ncbi:hypothetical protein V474_06620 [Novosphingobium barchaimii LL02]|uniref:Uncharacterized protein n=1 Tax=Novosphingobium barchaimii LL02 TaxID=1114963 RepID=A0A0J8A5A0_9SPHN|nr:hypothetical protein [Novosphingobium barchaimii]KMS50590.1 hypothetical protein V474_06620 [Novosphingobium barchaimii LL02]
MRFTTHRMSCALMALAAAAAAPTQAADYPQPLAEEPIPAVAQLPEKYPSNWVLVHDLFLGRAAERNRKVS